MVNMSSILPDFRGYRVTSGRFDVRLTERLGSGAYGVVYLAQTLSPLSLGPTHYAVKCLLRHPRGTDHARQQRREIAHHLAVSAHPNVVTLHAVVEEEFYNFLVMDYCGGGDLFNSIVTRRAYTGPEADLRVRESFLQVIDALQACHDAGVYHRDIKPENILTSKDDKIVYLSDFGLATRSATSKNLGCGSSFYMSPECLGIYKEKRPYATAPSDVWALGTVLANMITGRNPWHIADPQLDEGFRAYLRDGAAWLHRMLEISVGASQILARIFAVEPTARISLHDLREEVMALDSFFPSKGPEVTLHALPDRFVEGGPSAANPIVVVSSCAEAPVKVASSHGFEFLDIDVWGEIPRPGPTTPSTVNISSFVAALSATMVGAGTNFENDEQDLAEDDAEWTESPFTHPLTLSDEASASDSESDAESEGPITPVSHATHPASIVSDLSLERHASLRHGPLDIITLPKKEVLKFGRSVSRLVRVVSKFKLQA